VSKDEARREFWRLEGSVWTVQLPAYEHGVGVLATDDRSGYSHELWERNPDYHLSIVAVDLVDDPDPGYRE